MIRTLIAELLETYLEFLSSIADVLLLSEFLICGNYILYQFVKDRRKKHKPLWLLIFSAFIVIVSTKLFDVYILNESVICNPISKAICYYELLLIAKNTSKLLGIDLTKYIQLKK